jgi:hypothetical protein
MEEENEKEEELTTASRSTHDRKRSLPTHPLLLEKRRDERWKFEELWLTLKYNPPPLPF